MTFVVLRAVDELDDIVDLARGDWFQDLHLIVRPNVLRELAQQTSIARLIRCTRLK